MQFSLGGNSLQHYLNLDNKILTNSNNSDSLRSITDLSKLQGYFQEKKNMNEKAIDNLWRRIEQCESMCMQLSESVDLSYSRINEEKKVINIQRYEDLLPYSFKEVEWTKSSRVAVHQSQDKQQIVSKYQNCIIQFKNMMQLIQKQQAKILSQTQQQFIMESKEYQEVLNQKYVKSQRLFDNLAAKLIEAEECIHNQQEILEGSLQRQYRSLSNSIEIKITKIDEQIISFSK